MSIVEGQKSQIRWLEKETTGNYSHNMPREERVFSCSWCGEHFEVDSPYKVKEIKKRTDQRVFCSTECRREWFAKDWSQSEEWKDESKKRAVRILENGLIAKTYTEPQMLVDDILINKGIEFENEYNCKYHAIDNYLTEHNLMIEVMGTYWHCDHRIYSTIRYQNQVNRVIADKRKNTYINNNYDIKILYIWEYDIINNPKLVSNLIDLYVSNKGSLINYQSFNYFISGDNLYLDNNIEPSYFELSGNERKKYIDLKEKGLSRKQLDKWIKYNCEICGEETEQLASHYNKSKHHYCSQKCKKYVGQENYDCDNCGKHMNIPKYRLNDIRSGKRKSLCCSKKCSQEYKSNNFSKDNSPLYTSVEKTCLCCDEKYYVKNHRKNESKYCSYECHHKHNQAEHNCDNCGKHMIIPKSVKKELESGKRKTCCCSIECSNELRRKK